MKINATLGIRVLFSGTLALFALQMTFIYALKAEPYPALTMPSFAGHPSESGSIEMKEPAVEVRFVDGHTRSIPFESILPPSTTVLSGPVFSTAFAGDDFVADPETVAWLRSRICQIFPMEKPSG